MNPYVFSLVFALVALVQSTVTSHVRILGACPDLTLILAVVCGLRWGVRESLPAILVGGLMIDTLSGAPFGCATLALVIVSVLVGVAEANVPRSVKALPPIVLAAATLLYQLICMVSLAAWGRTVLWGPMFVREVLPSVLANLVFMPIIYWLVRALDRRQLDEPVV